MILGVVSDGVERGGGQAAGQFGAGLVSKGVSSSILY